MNPLDFGVFTFLSFSLGLNPVQNAKALGSILALPAAPNPPLFARRLYSRVYMLCAKPSLRQSKAW